MNVRTRFAPSPTGFMHVGSLRTAIFAWLFARKNGGQFLLRIEDTDKEREVEGSIGHIMQSLRWLGIDWDEGPDNGGPYEPYIQSARLPLYHEYARKLIASGFAYPDPYTSEEVEAFRAAAIAEKRPFLFRDHRPDVKIEDIENWYGEKPLRFRVPVIKRYEWHDLVYGDLSAGEEALDDFILIKSDGFPTYNFCHIVDDIEMKITHVMRGQEFISSTPKFLSLYDALELAPPAFATLPPILGEGGNKKLGKRDGAKDILDYRTEGYMPEAMLNFLVLIGWNPGTDQEIFSREELIEAFSLERIQNSGGQFDEEKLLFMNQQWMRRLTDEEFIQRGELAVPGAGERVPAELEDGAASGAEGTPARPRLLKAIPLLKERAHTFLEAREMLSGELLCLFAAPVPDKVKMKEKEAKNEECIKNQESAENDGGDFTAQALAKLVPLIQALPEEVSADAVKEALMPVADANPKECGGRGAILWPLRYALSGLERSPDPFTLISILGKEESVLRIQTALAILGE